MRLSRNFRLEEFLRSRTAARLGIDQTPPDYVVENLRRLCRELLQPVRDRIHAETGRPCVLHISSGYRSPALNGAIGGAPASDHLMGLAADVIASTLEPLELAETMLREAADGAPVRQVIHEFGQWVHVSIYPLGDGGPPEALTASRADGRVAYSPGLLSVDARTRELV